MQEIRSPQRWKQEIKKRDKNLCRQCGFDKNLEVHHIKPLEKFRDFATELDNGITLCGNHHALLKGKEESTNLKTIRPDTQTAEQLKRLNNKFCNYLLSKLDNPDERTKVAFQLLGQLQIYPDSFDQFFPLIQRFLNWENRADEGLAEQMVVEFLSNQSGRALQVVRKYEKKWSEAEKEMYSEAWSLLVKEPDKLIVDRLVGKVKELYPDRNEPTEDSAKQFLSEHSEEVLINTETKGGDEDTIPHKESKQNASQGERWSGKSVRIVVLEAVQKLTGGDTNVEFAPKDVYTQILKEYPDFNENSVRPQLMADCPNHRSYSHYPGEYHYYFWVRHGIYRLLDPEK